MRYATFEIDASNPVDLSSGTPNANVYCWLPLLAGAAQDAMVSLGGATLTFNEAGLYLITANLTCDVILPADADPQHAEVTGALAFDTGGIGT